MENSTLSGANRQLRWSRAYLRRVKRWRFVSHAALLVLVAFTLGLCVYAASTSGLLPVLGPAPSSDPPPAVSDPDTTSVPDAAEPDTPGECAVFFDARGGTMAQTLFHVATGEAVAQPADPAREGYAFTGWFADAARTVRWDFSENAVMQDITLYARWEAIAEPQPEALPQTGLPGRAAFWAAVLAASLCLAVPLALLLYKKEVSA